MRLICPNCGAQYEVEDSVIPDDGRDVQCSNCGHTWFQRPAHMDQALAEELDQHFEADAEEFGDAPEQEEKTNYSPAPKPARERRGLDPQVADVLREEAAHEAAARRGQDTSLETQPELGLDDSGDRAASRTAAARARMARLRSAHDTNPEAAAAALAAAASRRDLLPDIEEINSTLRATQDRSEGVVDSSYTAPTPKPQKGRGGLRKGFILVVLLAVIATAVYVMAPKIIALVPQAEPFLITYVAFANELRANAVEGVAVATTKIKDLIASVTGG